MPTGASRGRGEQGGCQGGGAVMIGSILPLSGPRKPWFAWMSRTPLPLPRPRLGGQAGEGSRARIRRTQHSEISAIFPSNGTKIAVHFPYSRLPSGRPLTFDHWPLSIVRCLREIAIARPARAAGMFYRDVEPAGVGRAVFPDASLWPVLANRSRISFPGPTFRSRLSVLPVAITRRLSGTKQPTGRFR